MTTKIYADDYLDNATRLAYSEDTYFPASNLYDGNARSKVYRSAGYFEVTALNKTIVFEETSSTPLTATIAEGTYASDTLLFAAVKAALEAAGASTYTVSRNTTSKKITIASNGSGGGGIFNLLWTNASTTAEDLLGFDNGSDDTSALTYTADTVRIHTEERLVWDFGAAVNPTTFILTGLRADGIQISSGATMKLQANATDVWSSPSVDLSLSWDSNIIYTENTAGLGSYRYWSLKVVDKDNPLGYVEVSNVFLGAALALSTGKVQLPFSGTYEDGTEVQVGPNLGFTAAGRNTGQSFSLGWGFLTKAEKETFDAFFSSYKQARPFFINLDDGAVLGTAADTYLVFARNTSPPSWTFEGLNRYSINQSIAEVN